MNSGHVTDLNEYRRRREAEREKDPALRGWYEHLCRGLIALSASYWLRGQAFDRKRPSGD